MPLTLKTPAKINWFLHVIGKRADGFHDIESLMQFVSVYDTLVFEESDGIDVVADVPVPLSDNLVYKAALALQAHAGIKRGARITLKKEIPLASGMAGGSSDAACALTGLCTLWGLDIAATELAELSASLGSDVPFFLNGPSALVEGRGERVTPVVLGISRDLLLAKPDVGISTKWAYSQVGELTKNHENIRLLGQAVSEGDFRFLKKASNDLECPAAERHPVIGEIKAMLYECGAKYSAMSGSGPTVFGVFESADAADEAGTYVSRRMPGLWLAAAKTLVR